MSNYTITTDFGAKDSLPSSNDSKVVRGSEFTTEFTNIQTAIATKADTAGDTFTGVVNFSADVAVNTNTLFVDVSEAKVGIGTTSPAYELDVDGSAQLSGGDLILRSDSDNADTQYIRFENYPTDIRTAYIRADYSSQTAGGGTALAFGANDHATATDTDSMVIDIEGNVGIGTSSPSSKLHVSSTDSVSITQTHTDGNTVSLKQSGTGGDVEWRNGNGEALILTNSQTRMTVDASGNVGIGTTSPSAKLDVELGADGVIAEFRGTDSDIFQIKGQSNTIALDTRNTEALTFEMQGTERMRIDAAGRVGIGHTNPTSKFVVQDTNGCVSKIVATDGGSAPSATAQLVMQGYEGRGAGIFIQDSKLSASSPNDRAWFMGTGYSTANFGIGYAADGVNSHYLAQNMLTVDTSGRLLVGTTDTSIYDSASGGNTGFVYSPNHLLQVARETTTSTQSVMNLNKMGVDGNIIELYKDGGIIGNIGAAVGNSYISGTARGFTFGAENIYACNQSGTKQDANTDLGHANYRFQDLYLSGGVHLGGTGSANKLDDYEEGTWTPNLYGHTTGSSSPLSYSAASTSYTKVGRLVYFNAYITNVSAAGHSLTGEFRISGLPFAASKHAPITFTHTDLFTFDEADISVSGYVSNGSTYISVRKGSSKGAVNVTELTNNNLSDLMISGVYTTNS